MHSIALIQYIRRCIFFYFLRKIYRLPGVYPERGIMMLYAASGLILLILMLYLMPVEISTKVEKHNDNVKIALGLKTLYGLLNINTEIAVLKLAFENGKPVLKYTVEVADREKSRLMARLNKLLGMEKGKGLVSAYKNNKDIIASPIRYITKKIMIRNLYLKIGMGTGDAAVTGLLYGTAWAVIGSIMAFTGSYVNIKKPRIIIAPIFGSVRLNLDFSCIIRMKTGHIINVGIRVIPALISGNRKKYINTTL